MTAMLIFFSVVSTESFVSKDSTSIGWDDVPSRKRVSSTAGNTGILLFPLIHVNLVIVGAK